MRRLAATLVVGYACLLVAWVLGNPPFVGPDEPAHFVRAAGIAAGDGWLGPRIQPKSAPRNGSSLVPSIMAFGAPQRAWIVTTSRTVRIREALVPRTVACNTFFTSLPFDCRTGPLRAPRRVVAVSTYAGEFPPLPHIVAAAGIAVAPSSSAAGALTAARMAQAAVCLALLAIAVVALAGRGPLPLTGLVLGLTPMAIFVCSVVTNSALTVAGCLACTACLLRAGRSGPPPRWLSPATAFAALVVCLARSEGPAWLVLCVLAAAAVPADIPLVRRPVWRWLGGAAAVGVVLSVVWTALANSSMHYSLKVAIEALKHEHRNFLSQLAHQVVGSFGWADTPVPTALADIWLTLLAVLVVLAVVSASARRLPLLIFLAAIALVPHVLYAFALYQRGRWDIDGRYVVPAVVVLGVFAGEAVERGQEKTPRWLARMLPPVALTAGALLQLWAWWWNARRQATGVNGPLWFFSHSVWTAPTGWLLPALTAAAGAVALMAAAWTARRARTARELTSASGPGRM